MPTMNRQVSDAVKTKDAGSGMTATTSDPFAALRLRSFSSQEEFDSLAQAVQGGAGAGSGQASRLIDSAKKFIGTPYKWGGTSPTGFDCSGFTQYLYKQIGIDLPRVSYQQGTYGQRVGVDQLKPGDLVLWDNSSRNSGADHVAIYIGNGQVIHAPKPGDAVKISTIWDSAHAWGVAMNLSGG